MALAFDAPTGRDAVRLSLICVTGPDLGRTFRIGFEPLIIGRGGVDIELSHTDISRRHARLSVGERGYQIEDLGSANGTFVNGALITGVAQLRIGDHVQIGNTVLVFAQRDELQERMQRVQRLEALGALAGGLAHDFNNTLAVIVANLDFIEESLPADATGGHSALAAVRKAALSGAALAKRVQRLGSTDPLTFAVVPLTELVEQTIGMVHRQIGEALTITTNIEPGLTMLGSYEELNQVLVNLLLNARDATPKGGTVRVEARSIQLDASDAGARDLPAAGPYVELTVSDAGTGMDEATLARAFEPFFTTKPRGKGSGLGLAMIHGCVRRHGGAIEVDSKVGRGTTFRLLFHSIQSGAPKPIDRPKPIEK